MDAIMQYAYRESCAFHLCQLQCQPCCWPYQFPTEPQLAQQRLFGRAVAVECHLWSALHSGLISALSVMVSDAPELESQRSDEIDLTDQLQGSQSVVLSCD